MNPFALNAPARNSTQDADDNELDALLGAAPDAQTGDAGEADACDPESIGSDAPIGLVSKDSVDYGTNSPNRYTQWARRGSVWIPTSPTTPAIEPGVYEIDVDEAVGLHFDAIPVKTEGLLRLRPALQNRPSQRRIARHLPRSSGGRARFAPGRCGAVGRRHRKFLARSPQGTLRRRGYPSKRNTATPCTACRA